MPEARLRIVYLGAWDTDPGEGQEANVRAHLTALAGAVPDASPILLGSEPAVLSERFGVDAAADLSRHLIAPDPAGELPRRGLMLRRLASLLAAAEGRGAPPDVPGVAATIDLLGSADAVIDLGADSLASAHRDALWNQAAAAYVAIARGVRVLVSVDSIGPIEDDLDAVVLGRLLRGAVLVAIRENAGAAAYARTLGAGDVVEGLDEDGQLARGLAPGAAEAKR